MTYKVNIVFVYGDGRSIRYDIKYRYFVDEIWVRYQCLFIVKIALYYAEHSNLQFMNYFIDSIGQFLSELTMSAVVKNITA